MYGTDMGRICGRNFYIPCMYKHSDKCLTCPHNREGIVKSAMIDAIEVKHEDIWAFKQNKPTLIAKDFELFYGIPRENTYKILLARGVFKWFAVRRDLIRLKATWKDNIKYINSFNKLYGRVPFIHRKNRDWWKGYLKAMEECRAEIRALCHSDRWQAPDNDRDARRFLDEQENCGS